MGIIYLFNKKFSQWVFRVLVRWLVGRVINFGVLDLQEKNSDSALGLVVFVKE